MTQKWFENEAACYDLYTSTLALKEIKALNNLDKRSQILEIFTSSAINVLELTNDAMALGDEYMSKGAIPLTEPEDAYHIAIATINGIEALASWNFKHIVSINPIRKIHEINLKLNYQIIEIGSLELFGGAIYGNL